jgi:hypothetical protein
MDVAAQSSSIMYIVFAGSISINKKRIASNCSTISCRNSPHRQLKFAIGHNGSLIAILLIHDFRGSANELKADAHFHGCWSFFCIFFSLPRGSSAACVGTSWVGATRAMLLQMPSGEIWGETDQNPGRQSGLSPAHF